MANNQNKIFIVGALNRSGTNFLSDIVQLDARFEPSPNIGEDYFLVYSDLLETYCKQTTRHWGKSWREPNNTGSQDMIKAIGESLLSFSLNGSSCSQHVVFKTPRADNLSNFFKMFPELKVMLLVRDGRDTVDSFLKSFDNYSFIDVVKLWVKGVESILSFIEKCDAGSKNNVLLLKYEDIINGCPETVNKICDFCSLDPISVNINSIQDMPLRGSSVIRGGSKEVHWGLESKPKDYALQGKWRSWPKFKKILFNLIAGNTMKKLGYGKA